METVACMTSCLGLLTVFLVDNVGSLLCLEDCERRRPYNHTRCLIILVDLVWIARGLSLGDNLVRGVSGVDSVSRM